MVPSQYFPFITPHPKHLHTHNQLGNQGIYNKGWTAGTTPVALPWVGAEIDVDPIDGYEWELYNVNEDPTQSNNIVRVYV